MRAFQDYPYAGSAGWLDSPCGQASTSSLRAGEQVIAGLRGKEEAQEKDIFFGIVLAQLCDYTLGLKPDGITPVELYLSARIRGMPLNSVGICIGRDSSYDGEYMRISSFQAEQIAIFPQSF